MNLEHSQNEENNSCILFGQRFLVFPFAQVRFSELMVE